MYKLCKWIYELGYMRGVEDGKRQVYDEQESDYLIKKLLKEDKL